MQRKHTNRNLKVESLESRRMMAGDMDAFAYGKFLYVMGDNADNGVAIVDGGDGTISVIGLDQGGSPTTVNGDSDPVSFYKISNVIVSTGKGDDAVVVSNLTLKGTLSVFGDHGNDAIALGDFEDVNDLIDDAADALLGALTVNKSVFIQDGLGDNSIIIGGLDVRKSMQLVTGNGNDSIDWQGDLANAVGKSLSINTGNGNDSVSLANLAIGKSFTMNTSTGDDTVTLQDLSAKSLNVVLGTGDDTITVEDVAIAKNATFNGVNGDDEFIGLGTNTYGKKFKQLKFTTIV
jgi:hypothetical protein